ncbi:MAG: response regulator [bacterium]
MNQERAHIVLVADDDEINLHAIEQLLTKSPVSTEFAADGDAVIEVFQQLLVEGRPPSLILMDIDMPLKSGIEACRAIRQIESQQGLDPIPIIALTAQTAQKTKQAALSAGMDGFLTKPATKQVLQSAIHKAIFGS